ncbi:N-acetylmuramic acid 6-phosphate etherase [Paenibacillus sp. UNCCL117]|uniref:N-acetylmuramic acid 6-phosphate etherase n=1 Tax=unclassified Paenibacillus TaxID=185978 RepID=UPI0008875984|nr:MULTISPECIES: N-acetylmuramic acid 6-phosphate etherase [unclassified Paenibacillus]SDE49067.1 N-acetylmuramic acid 6-phosphate etherase [Paenibacillus sp. cl123]SFW66802.1 N-acetylmuramic acid 6-phosphate etherase [Paenibacillus sp. UNCCL117]
MSANKERAETERLKALASEQVNRRSSDLDQMTTETILLTMNDEDQKVAGAVRAAIPQITAAVELIVGRFRRGGRLIYVGAGTSGRLAVIDALECPPTFGTPEGQVAFALAGGPAAMLLAEEGAEDDAARGAEDLRSLELGADDCIAAVSASGRTPYCIGALQYARSAGAATIAVSCNANAAMSGLADAAIEVLTGPEVLAGSTRLKAGTAQKIVLNMLSTASMVRTGRVYGNQMVDMQPSNGKLRQRAVQMTADIAGASEEQAKQALEAAGWSIKRAIVCLMAGVDPGEAERKLAAAGGFLRTAVTPELRPDRPV